MAQSKQREMLRCSGERYNLHTRRGARGTRARLRCMLCGDDTGVLLNEKQFVNSLMGPRSVLMLHIYLIHTVLYDYVQ